MELGVVKEKGGQEKRQMGQGAEYLLKKGIETCGIIILVISEILTIVILTADTLGYL